MWSFRRWGRIGSRNNPAEVESLEQQVTVLRATLATCKGIAQRREHWLVAAVAAFVLVLGFAIVANRKPLEPAISEWIPAFGTAQPAQGIDAAYAAYQNGDYAIALRLSSPLAEQGDGRAQSLLGLIYYNGHGVRRDEREAMKWFRRAADQGDAAAQLQIGVMYSGGRGVPQDYSEAASWYQKAAEHGNAEAQYNLGILYADGQGVPQDNVLAHMWFNLAAALLTASVPRDRAVGNRDIVARKMSPEEIARAQELARVWKPK
jgi:TPR repeat protein